MFMSIDITQMHFIFEKFEDYISEDKILHFNLTIKNALRINLMNENVIWLSYEKESTIKDLKMTIPYHALKLENAEELNEI